MLVDDEESIRTAVGQLLTKSGFGTVTTCSDGSEAFQQLVMRIDIVAGDDNGDSGSAHTTPSPSNNQKFIPDCLITDLRMPVMDGIELIRKIRRLPELDGDGIAAAEEEEQQVPSSSNILLQRLAQIPIVALTAKGLVQDRIDGYDAGVDAYLSKPFAPEELVVICDQALERYQSDMSLPPTNVNGNNMFPSSNANNNLRNPSLAAGTSADVQVAELKRDLDEIKGLLLEQGGGGIGNGYVERTGVFLTKDERQVLELLSDGLMTKEIASETHLSTRRIEQLLTRMFRKAGVSNRTELVRWAVSSGNVDRT
jgi:DNA-binding NarL/FixJ family response regulator